MIKIYIYSCLLSALTVVAVKLHKNGQVGENVTFSCSGWDVWTDVKSKDKYLCHVPCKSNKHIIIKAAAGKTEHKKRIRLNNTGERLLVTFTDLQMSDSNTYICGLERFGSDAYIEVKLTVREGPKTTAETVAVGSIGLFATVNSSIMSSSSSDIIANMSASYTILHTTPAASETQGAGNALYLTVGLISILTIVMVLLVLTRKVKKQKMVVTTTHGNIEESVGPDGVYQSLHLSTKDNDQVYSTLTPTRTGLVPDGVYQTLHLSTEDEDQAYSALTPHPPRE